MTFDEQDLRAGLRVLSRGVPPAPADRAGSAVRRSVRIRRTRAVASVALTVALVAPVAYVALDPDTRTSRPATPAASMLRWPDRRDDSYRDLSERAVEAYTSEPGARGVGQTVRHLWAGRVPGTDYVGAAFALCGEDDCSYAVLTVAHRAFTDHRAWDRTVVRAVRDGLPVEPLSMLVPTRDANLDYAASTALVIAPPGADEATWESRPAQPGTGGSGSFRKRDGIFTGTVGWVSAPVVVRVTDRSGRSLGEGTVGDPDGDTGVGRNAMIALPKVPAGLTALGTSRDQIGPNGATAGHPRSQGAQGPSAILVRCQGAAPIKVLGANLRGDVPCDGRTHRIDSYGAVLTSDDPYAVYALVFVIPSRPG